MSLFKPVTLLPLVFFALSACNKQEELPQPKMQEENNVPQLIEVDEHTPENSLDWEGLYQGILPCASCEGIEAELRLSFDNSYTYQTKYLGKPDGEDVFEQSGDLKWINGSIIELDSNGQKTFFIVGENFVELRDIEGNPIESSTNLNYRLEKAQEE